MKINHYNGTSKERQVHQLKIRVLSLAAGEVNGQTTTDTCTCDNMLAVKVYCTVHVYNTQAQS
jgi:hypothetical protein